MSRAGALTARIVPRIADIAADQWDACALADAAKLNPFVAHAFLKALEDAGCVGRGTGWTPSHIVVEGRVFAGHVVHAHLCQEP